MDHLTQNDIRRILAGRESIIPELHGKDIRAKENIAAKECPKCQHPLVPAIPEDPAKVFGATGINYIGKCPNHGIIDD